MTQTVRLNVEGMTCAACQSHVRRAIEDTPGVVKAAVRLLSADASVEFDPAIVELPRLMDAIRDAGYDASIPAPSRDAFEERAATEQRQVREARVLGLKAIASLAAGAVAMAVSMQWMHSGLANELLLLLTAAVMALAGGPIYAGAVRAALKGSADMNALVAIGTGSAFIYSVAATFHWLHGDVYYEAAIFILAFVLCGKALEARAKRQATGALRELAALQVAEARVERDGVELSLRVEELRAGDILVIRPGDRLPADGEIIDGSSYVDESMLTGEPEPVPKSTSDAVTGGTINTTGSFRYRATALGDDSVLAHILRLMRDAESSRAPIERTADRVAGVFVPVVIAVAITTFIAWTFADAPMSRAASAALAVLVIACPCAMGLAVPTAVVTAAGRGAGLGLLVKGAETMELLRRVDIVVFDKTGTLTEGKPRVVECDLSSDALRLAAAAEKRSEHPLGRAIIDYALSQGIDIPEPSSFEAIPGEGVRAQVDGHAVEVSRRGVFVDGTKQGEIRTADPVRASSARAVADLQAMGIECVLLTGDREETAHRVAQAIGIERVTAGVLPQGKLAAIEKLRAEGKVVAMIGDGINDAPALARADVGIAMGSGSGTAIEAGGVTLLRPDLIGVPRLLRLARAAWRVVMQNFAWALVYNVVAIPAAALGYLSPVLASAAMALSSVSVVTNSLRLRRVRIGQND